MSTTESHVTPSSGDPGVVFWPSVCSREPFWNGTLVLPTQNRPDVSVCFQNTILNWVPCALLWIAAPFYIRFLIQRCDPVIQRCSRSRRSFLNIAKLIFGVILILLPFAELSVVVSKSQDHGVYLQYLLASAVRFVTMILATTLMSVEFRRAICTSGLFGTFWFIYAVFSSVSVYSYAIRKQDGTLNDFEKAYFDVLLVSYVFILLQFILQFFTDQTVLNHLLVSSDEDSPNVYARNERRVNSEDEREPLLSDSETSNTFSPQRSPQRSASFYSQLFFVWVLPILYIGNKREHTYDTLHDIRPSEMTTNLLPRYEKHLDSMNNSTETRSARQIYMWCLLKTVAPAVALWGFLRLVTIFLLIVNLLIFKKLIVYVKDKSDNSSHTPWLGYIYASSLFLVTALRGLGVAHWLYGCDRVGMHLRTLVTMTIYRKMLKLSSACALQNMDIGYIVNLMSVDSLKLYQMIRSLHEVVTLPVYLVLATYFLYTNLNLAAIIGMVVMIVVVPLTSFIIARLTNRLQDKQMDAKDKRLKALNEILTGIKVLKLYAWEVPFETKVTEMRNEEMRCIRLAALLNAIGNTICLFSPFMISLIMFAFYVFTADNTVLDPSIAFVCLSLICLVNYNVSTLPSSVAYIIQGYISLKRAAILMDMEEVETDLNRAFVDSGPAVCIKNGSFAWGESTAFLKKINLSIAPGSLVAIVGSVGSGKSSMLACLLGEMKTIQGTVAIQKNVAYVSQQAWIQNGTVKDNICFNKPFIPKRYQKVIAACSLTEDLKGLKGGDMTEIGGKGVNLSGGQKQRVNLARAVYQKADVYLIDDSLSAVDTRVGKHIFKEVIGKQGLLRNKTRIFATNSLGFLPEVDHIVVMKNGSIQEIGTYATLMRSNGDFSSILQAYTAEESKSSVHPSDVRIVPSKSKSIDHNRFLGDINESFKLLHMRSETLYSLGASSLMCQMSSVDDFDISGNFCMDTDMANNAATSRLIENEEAGTGFIKWSVVWNYIKSGGLFLFALVLIGHCCFIGSMASTYIWLQRWTDYNHTLTSLKTDRYYVTVYGVFGAVELLSIMVNCFVLAVGFVVASRMLHIRALGRLFRAPISFFDTTAPGRILNYLSTDMDTVDNALPLDVQLWSMSISFLVCSVITIAVADPVFLAIVLPILIVNVFVQRIYGKNAIPLKREYALRKSPVYSHFEETICGAPSIRAYRKQDQFIKKCDILTDESHKPWHCYLVCWRWYTLYNEMVGAIAVFLTAVTAVALEHQRHESTEDRMTAGQVGLALFSVFQILPHIPIASRMMIEIEANIVAVERIIQYCNIAQEASWESAPDNEPRPSWPENGSISFNDFSIRHRPGLDLVLSDLTFNIRAREKVGVVGRTGAGKSSIILSLFRIMEAAGGSIEIDGVGIADIGLHDLRSKLTTIPQDPILFSGTLRSNLDPLDSYTDGQIWNALEQSHLKKFVNDTMPNGLNHRVSNGDEISIGQRQLLCLARALLRNSKVIILDEATAGVDYKTDEQIQTTIREQFGQSTVITVAHRLATIMDYDRVMVLDAGRLKEFAPPRELLARAGSVFAAMAKDTKLQS